MIYYSLQDFQLEKRLDNELIEAAAPVLQGVKTRVDIEMKITNEDRAFASTLSYHISMYVSTYVHKYICAGNIFICYKCELFVLTSFKRIFTL